MKLILAAFLSLSATAWAHGENKKGPHEGIVRMPGAFHSEIVPGKNGNFDIYLLDMGFKNPTLEKSKVTARAVHGKSAISYRCFRGAEKFSCIADKKVPAKSTLEVIAIRENAKGKKMTYPMPLIVPN